MKDFQHILSRQGIVESLTSTRDKTNLEYMSECKPHLQVNFVRLS